MITTNRHVPLVLVVNAGSSSLRLACYALESLPRCVAESHLSEAPKQDPMTLTRFVQDHSLANFDLVIHRVVHGGPRLDESCLVDAAVEDEIRRLDKLAPLHNGVALGWIDAVREAFGATVPQAVCFDTGFYKTLPPLATTYALPREIREQYDIRRYGFHGLAHQSLLNQWGLQPGACADGRVISMQLGAGCSVTATNHGWPVETSMGFSPLEGLMMATRCGDLDPSVALYLIDQCGFSSAEVERIFNESSGLLAISGQSGDMQEVLQSEHSDAAFAVAMFCHRACKYLGAYLAVLGGADAIIFGGGIGQHAPEIRIGILEHFEWAGIAVDPKRNIEVDPTRGGPIHADASAVEVWVIPTDEGAVMANDAKKLLDMGTTEVGSLK